MKFYFTGQAGLKLLLLAIFLLPTAVQAEFETHGQALTCPNIKLESLTGRYELQINPTPNEKESKNTLLRFIWNDSERNPQMALQEEIFTRILGDISIFFSRHFGEKGLLTEINIVQTQLANGIGALYCRSYQFDPKRSITLFLSPKSLESSSEFTRLLVHELVHHWFFKNGKHSAPWIEEGIAYVSEYLMTGRMSGQPVIQYLKHSTVSLTETNKAAPMLQMGHAQLLFIYLFEKLGDLFLNQLLRTEMTNIDQITSSLPPNNNFHWQTFKDAFRDFQIAKFLNRQDYLAQSDSYRMKYFLHPTTIKAESTNDLPPLSAWSAVEYKSQDQMEKSKLPNLNYENLVVIDEPGLPILISKGSDSNQSDSNQSVGKRYLQIIYQPH